MKYQYVYDTALGKISLEETDGCISQVFFGPEGVCEESQIRESPLLRMAMQQLDAYLAGALQVFDLPLKPVGTAFQHKVWTALRTIPYGETRSYGAVAAAIGNPKAARAVGLANNHNPIAIITPCHRVIGAKGNLVGYAGGLDIKEKLLQLEARHKRADSIPA